MFGIKNMWTNYSLLRFDNGEGALYIFIANLFSTQIIGGAKELLVLL